MKIRRAEKKDIPQIMKLLYQVAEVHHVARPDLFRGNAAKYEPAELEEILADEKKPIFAAVDENDVLQGYAFCVVEEKKDNHVLVPVTSLYIDDLCVEEHQRGTHIGSALFEYVKEYARSIGCYDVTLNVWEGNDSAKAFYMSRGMRVMKTGMEYILEQEKEENA